MTKQTQTIASEAINGLNALIHESDAFREWDSAEIQELVREAEKLKKSDARVAYICLGAIAAICGNVADVLVFFGKALHLGDKDATNAEFRVSLGNVGMYSKGQEIGTLLLDPRRHFFQSIWEQAASMGQIREVWNRLAEAKKAFPDLAKVDFSALEIAASIMETRGITDGHLGAVLDVMGEIQRSHRIMFSGQAVSSCKVIRPPEDLPYLFVTMSLKASVGKIHEMNRELARLIVEKLPGGTFPQGVVASFSKAYPVELRAAA